ncbi:MAG TPA: DUF883 domain-containing protein [Pseudomonadales bacterium]|nr:DUF883 domain-containing protein [Pseudomonadales bacterium]
MKHQHHPNVQESAANLAEDAQALLAATADVAETKVIEARKRLSAALERGKEAWGQVQDYTAAQAKAADELVREYPYQSIGIALGVGALLGLLMSRRS